MTEATLHPLRVGTIQITIIAAYEALKCIFIRKLLSDLGLMLQTFVAPLNHICSVNAFSDRLRKFVKRVQTFLGTFEDPCKFRIAFFDGFKNWFLFPYLKELSFTQNIIHYRQLVNNTTKRSNIMLKYQKTCQIILLILGVSMISYGAVRGEAATVLGKAIKLCLECVGIG